LRSPLVTELTRNLRWASTCSTTDSDRVERGRRDCCASGRGSVLPYLVKEIRRGKIELGSRIPTGAGDVRPGRRGNPAPGQPDAQADPYTTLRQGV